MVWSEVTGLKLQQGPAALGLGGETQSCGDSELLWRFQSVSLHGESRALGFPESYTPEPGTLGCRSWPPARGVKSWPGTQPRTHEVRGRSRAAVTGMGFPTEPLVNEDRRLRRAMGWRQGLWEVLSSRDGECSYERAHAPLPLLSAT